MTMDNTTQYPPTYRQRRWLSEEQAAAYLDCSRSFLAKARMSGLHNIIFARLGRHIRYDLADLDNFLERSKAQSKAV